MHRLHKRFKALVSTAVVLSGLCAACDRTGELSAAPWTADVDPPPQAAVVRRLTRDELAGTYRALIGVVPDNLSRLPAEASELSATAPPVSSFEVEVYREIADEAARMAAPRLLESWACDGDHECLERSLGAWIETAQRRQLPEDERATYVGLLKANDKDSLRRLLDLIFQTPHFLYIIESRQAGAWELAARLAYLLWSEPPDEALRAAAKSSELADPTVLEAHVRRMLEDPRAARTIGATFARWAAPDLSVAAKAYSVYPELDAILRASMTEQFDEFAALALAQHFSLRDMLTTRQLPVDTALAKLLAVAKDKLDPQAQWSVVTLQEPRFGLLTLPGVLSSRARADDSSPVQRGLLIRDGMLCQPIPDPPPGVAALPPPASAGSTFRERLAAHTTEPTCAGCHRLMDPLGFPFEIYDGIGRLRKNSAGIATYGKLDAVAMPADYRDLQGLVDALLATPELPHCWATQWIARLLGREATQDTELVEHIEARFAAGTPLSEVLVEIIIAPHL
jgi:hypothetical protein